MIKIRAEIFLSENGRKTPFISGYRPVFDFGAETQTSGKIDLIECSYFYPGEKKEVFIYFLTNKYLGKDLCEGKRFTFGEGEPPLAEGVVSEIIYLD